LDVLFRLGDYPLQFVNAFAFEHGLLLSFFGFGQQDYGTAVEEWQIVDRNRCDSVVDSQNENEAFGIRELLM
jgi:hypothetical protein